MCQRNYIGVEFTYVSHEIKIENKCSYIGQTNREKKANWMETNRSNLLCNMYSYFTTYVFKAKSTSDRCVFIWALNRFNCILFHYRFTVTWTIYTNLLALFSFILCKLGISFLVIHIGSKQNAITFSFSIILAFLVPPHSLCLSILLIISFLLHVFVSIAP